MERMDQQADNAFEDTELWNAFLSDRSPDSRNLLIQRYMRTAQRIAASMFAQRPFQELEFSDYLQYARIGLLEAIDKYNPTRGASFQTYAGYRIKGSILNGIEATSELAAQAAYRRRMLKDRVVSVQQVFHEDSGQDKDPFETLATTAINLALGYVLEEPATHQADLIDAAHDPYRSCELKILADRLRLIVDALPERERTVIKGHYFDHDDFQELATKLGVTKGRVSQLHARGLTLVREACRQMNNFDVSA